MTLVVYGKIVVYDPTIGGAGALSLGEHTWDEAGLKREMDRARSEGESDARLTSLERWNDAQNGRLKRIEDKVDKLVWLIMATLAAALGGVLAQVLPHILKQ
jgi:hypothetical protein